MATNADKKRWDSLRAQLAKATEAKEALELQLGSKYGHNFQRSWLSAGQRNKLEALQERVNKIGDKIIAMIPEVSPRGDKWFSGVPSHWLRNELTWEDLIRPANEPLSVVVPGAWGYRDGHMSERRVEVSRHREPEVRQLRLSDDLEARLVGTLGFNKTLKAPTETWVVHPTGEPGNSILQVEVYRPKGSLSWESWGGNYTRAHQRETAKLLVDARNAYQNRNGNMMASRKKTAKRAPKKADFDDEEEVLAEVRAELIKNKDADKNDGFSMGEDRGLSSFGEGTVYEIDNGQSWCVVENDDQFEALALAVVKQDLEQEPEIFNKDFIEQHINTDKLRRELESDVQNMAEEDLREMDAEEFWKEYDRTFDLPDDVEAAQDEGEDPRDPEDSEIEELAEDRTKDLLKDPMSYLEDIYGDEAAAKAIEIAGLDIDAAAQAAVDEDGVEHFLCRYDGNYYTSPSGFVFWRNN